MRISLQPGFLLHSREYRESSLLLEALTLEHGRVGLVAKGGRRSNSPLRGVLQPFYPLLLSWSGKKELKTLTGAEAEGWVPVLTGRSLFSGLYLNELIMRLLHRNDPHPELLPCYRGALESLARKEDEEPILRLFEYRLLAELGYGMELAREAATGQPVQPGKRYCYRMEHGVVPAEQGGGIEIGGTTLVALATGDLHGGEPLREAKLLMRHVLRHYLGDKPLASRELFQTVG